MDPITALQTAMVTACNGHVGLSALVGTDGVGDAPPKAKILPYIAITKHRLTMRPHDEAFDNEHHVQLTAWVKNADRSAAAQITHELIDALTVGTLAHANLNIISRDFLRTDVTFEARSGRTRARSEFRFFTETI